MLSWISRQLFGFCRHALEIEKASMGYYCIIEDSKSCFPKKIIKKTEKIGPHFWRYFKKNFKGLKIRPYPPYFLFHFTLSSTCLSVFSSRKADKPHFWSNQFFKG